MYVIQNHLGEYIALDSASGGYPYPVKEVTRAEMWNSIEAAEKYTRACGEIENWKVLAVEVITAEVPMSRDRCIVIETGAVDDGCQFNICQTVKIPAQHKDLQQSLWSSIANGYRHDPHWKVTKEANPSSEEQRIEFAHRDTPSQRVRVYTESN